MWAPSSSLFGRAMSITWTRDIIPKPMTPVQGRWTPRDFESMTWSWRIQQAMATINRAVPVLESCWMIAGIQNISTSMTWHLCFMEKLNRCHALSNTEVPCYNLVVLNPLYVDYPANALNCIPEEKANIEDCDWQNLKLPPPPPLCPDMTLKFVGISWRMVTSQNLDWPECKAREQMPIQLRGTQPQQLPSSSWLISNCQCQWSGHTIRPLRVLVVQMRGLTALEATSMAKECLPVQREEAMEESLESRVIYWLWGSRERGLGDLWVIALSNVAFLTAVGGCLNYNTINNTRHCSVGPKP